MADPKTEYPVFTGHLQELVTVLDAAYGLSLADDLRRRYLNVQQQTRVSPLTNLLQTQLDRFEAYLEDSQKAPKVVEEVGTDVP